MFIHKRGDALWREPALLDEQWARGERVERCAVRSRKPWCQWWCEPLLLALEERGRNVSFKERAQDAFAPAVLHHVLVRQREREPKDILVEERRSRFEPMRHRRDI